MKTHFTLSFVLTLLYSQCLMAAAYRSAGSGPWMVATNWQVLTSGWTTASSPPSSSDDVIIRTGHSIIIVDLDGGISDNAHAGSILIENGASLILEHTFLELFLYNTATGADLIVNGTYQDNGSTGNGTRFLGGATWQLGTNGTFIKSNNSSAATYQDNYEAGMASIPATANWVVRYIGAADPTFTAAGTYYPNLRFENYSGGNWNPLIGTSHFQGSSSTATILGNLDVGSSGGGTVNIYNENTSASPIVVQGNITIGFGSTLSNQGTFGIGTGFYCYGSISVAGTLIVAGEVTGLTFGNAGTQTFAGSGTVLLDNLTVFNNNGLNLARDLQVTNLSLGLGKVMLNGFNLTVLGDISGAYAQSYVQTNGFGPGSGQLIRPVSGSVVFPVGNDQYNPAILLHSGSGHFGVRVEDIVENNGIQQTTDIVNRTWYVEGSINGTLNLTVQWNPAQELAGFDRNNCYIAHYNGSTWDTGPTGNASAGPPYTFTRSGINSLSPFVVASSGALLPVELTDFQAKMTDLGAALSWATATEIQNAYFEVERSGDGRNFQSLGKITGAGTTQQPQAYHFLDKFPEVGKSYYRLRQVDFDGGFTFSELRSVLNTNQKASSLQVYPNPASDKLNLEYALPTNSSQKLQLFNSFGQLVHKYASTDTNGPKQIDISGLRSGIYFLLLGEERVWFLKE